MAGSSGSYDSKDGVMTMEGVYVQHYMKAMDKLQEAWMGEKGFDRDKFNAQLLYLMRLLPDKKKQKEILINWLESKTAHEQMGLSANETQMFSGMEVVTEVVLFVCQAFELVNEDIIGPATAKQYQNAAIVLPEMPTEQEKALDKLIGIKPEVTEE
jgi:hypothetical protein